MSWRSFTCLAFFLFGAATYLEAQTGVEWEWIRIDPRIQNRLLNDIDMLTPAFGVAVGDGGLVRVTRDSGRTWTARRLTTRSDLHAVRFLDSSTVIVAGERGEILRSTNGGVDWRFAIATVTDTLFDIEIVDRTDAIAAGSDGHIVRSVDAGSTWQVVTIERSPTIRDIGVSAGGACIAVCDDGSVLGSTDHGRSWRLINMLAVRPKQVLSLGGRRWAAFGDPWSTCLSSDDGATWTVKTIDSANAVLMPNAEITIATFFGSDSGFVGVYNRLGVFFRKGYQTIDGGASWNAVEDPTTQGRVASLARSIDRSSDLGAVAIGNGYSWWTSDGGSSWQESTIALMTVYRAIAFADSLHGVIVGEDSPSANRYLFSDRTTDGGETWTRAEVWPSGRLRMRGVAYPHRSYCIAIADSGLVFRSSDHGSSWSSVSSGTTEPLTSISFADSLHGMIVGGGSVVLGTTDGGATWDRLPPPTFEEVFEEVDVPTASVAYVRGTSLYRSIDGGQSWSLQASPALSTVQLGGLYFGSPRSGIAAGGVRIPGHPAGFSMDALYLTNDSGESWQLATVTQIDSGLSLNAVALWDGPFGLAVGTQARVLATTDGGQGWLQLPRPLPSNSSDGLIDVCFAAPRTAFVMGNLGQLLRYRTSAIAQARVNDESATGANVRWTIDTDDGQSILRLTLERNSDVELNLFDVAGHHIARPVKLKGLRAGEHEIPIELGGLPSGQYIVRLRSDDRTSVLKISWRR